MKTTAQTKSPASEPQPQPLLRDAGREALPVTASLLAHAGTGTPETDKRSPIDGDAFGDRDFFPDTDQADFGAAEDNGCSEVDETTEATYDEDDYKEYYLEPGGGSSMAPGSDSQNTGAGLGGLGESKVASAGAAPLVGSDDGLPYPCAPLAGGIALTPEELYRYGSRLGQPTDNDLGSLHGRRRKMIEVADAVFCPIVGELLRRGHMSLSVAAIKESFERKGAKFAFDRGYLYRYNEEGGRYEAANEPFERELLELTVGLSEELRRIRLVTSVWENKIASAVLGALPRARGGQASIQDCRASLYPLWQPPAPMNGDQWTLNVSNGLLDLRTQTLRSHTATHASSLQLPFAFEPNASCDHWDAYLEQAIPDASTRDVLQEWTGYCLIPTTKFEMALFLLGPGGTGKSTFLKTLRKLVGEGNCAAVGLEDLGDKFRVGGLRDKLLNVVTEINPNKALNDSRFKAFVSGDPVTGEQKFKDPGVFLSVARFVVASNTLPMVRDQTDAFYRRIIMVRFDQKFVSNPNPLADPPEKRMDPDLGAKLDAEMSGVLNWALEGLARLMARGRFDLPASLQTNVEAFREDQDNALRFLHDACVFGDEFEVSTTDAFRLYLAWCKANGEKAHSNNVFGRIVANHKGVQAKKSGTKGRFYKGVRPADGVTAAKASTGTAPAVEVPQREATCGEPAE